MVVIAKDSEQAIKLAEAVTALRQWQYNDEVERAIVDLNLMEVMLL